MELLQVDRKTCTQCGICAAICPGWFIDFQTNNYPKPGVRAELECIRCGHCVAVCPTGSLTHREMPVEKCPPIQKGLQITAEQVEELLKSRRSIRVYKDQPVSRDILVRLIEIARYSPTGHNNQEVEWLVIDKRETLQRLEEIGIDWMRWMISNQPKMATLFNMEELAKHQEKFKNAMLRDAPALIIAHAPKDNTIAIIDSATALSFLDLAAKSMGLGCCWAGYVYVMANGFAPAKELIALPAGHSAYGCMLLGYPKFNYQRIPMRKPPKIIWHSQ